MQTYEDIEERLGCRLPAAIKYVSDNSPLIQHVALLFNQRTRQILSYATNKRITGKQYYDDCCTRISVHAEQELLHKCSRQLRIPKNQFRGQKTLISLRFNRSGQMGHSRVCAACAQMISNKCRDLISNIMYMDDNNTLREVSIDEMCYCATPSSGDKRNRGNTFRVLRRSHILCPYNRRNKRTEKAPHLSNPIWEISHTPHHKQ